MAYSELVKNFEKVRGYMREFYIYGFKSRSEYDGKSARSYDDERRRIESWLGGYMRFAKTPEGKNVFLSVDSRVARANPFYKAWKAKSFTDGDITLHFILFDILCDPSIKMTPSALTEQVDRYLHDFDEPMTFDESTVRKKLQEYVCAGLVCTERQGRRVLYSRAADTDLSGLDDLLDFFSEAAPCGVVGSFLLDKAAPHESVFAFKHHYITQAMDSGILARLFDAMQNKSYVTAKYLGKRSDTPEALRLVPLRIYISAQNGRQNLIAFHEKTNFLGSYRLDYMSDVCAGEPCGKFDDLRRALAKAEKHMWGVNCRWSMNHLEHVEFEVWVADDEPHIIGRLQREKRCGSVEMLDKNRYRFTADVFDTNEMLPWIQTFICRITRVSFSNKTAETRLKEDIRQMYRMYGVEGGDGA